MNAFVLVLLDIENTPSKKKKLTIDAMRKKHFFNSPTAVAQRESTTKCKELDDKKVKQIFQFCKKSLIGLARSINCPGHTLQNRRNKNSFRSKTFGNVKKNLQCKLSKIFYFKSMKKSTVKFA